VKPPAKIHWLLMMGKILLAPIKKNIFFCRRYIIRSSHGTSRIVSQKEFG
jgi:hypothetical protein